MEIRLCLAFSQGFFPLLTASYWGNFLTEGSNAEEVKEKELIQKSIKMQTKFDCGIAYSKKWNSIEIIIILCKNKIWQYYWKK